MIREIPASSNGLHPANNTGPYLSADISIDTLSKLYDFVKTNDLVNIVTDKQRQVHP